MIDDQHLRRRDEDAFLNAILALDTIASTSGGSRELASGSSMMFI
jgi:hypothetical protein